MQFSIGDDGDFVGVSSSAPKSLNVFPTNTSGTSASNSSTVADFNWGGLASGVLQFGTAAVNTYGAIKQSELQKQSIQPTGGMIPGLDKTQSYLVLGGAGLVAVILVFSLMRK